MLHALFMEPIQNHEQKSGRFYLPYLCKRSAHSELFVVLGKMIICPYVLHTVWAFISDKLANQSGNGALQYETLR